VHGFEITEGVIDAVEGGFQVRISFVMLGLNDGTSIRDGLEHYLVGFMTVDCGVSRGHVLT